jgi:hypothetical protein
MSDISPETTSSSGSRRRQIFPENLSRSSTSQQQGYERANMAPSPSAVDGRAAITQGCASARNELNKRAPAPHVPPAARDSAAARSRRAGHPARSGAWGPGQPRVNGWCSRGQATTRAPQPPNAALITRVLPPYPALSRSRPLDVNPRARARARRPMAGAGEPAPYARVPARRPGSGRALSPLARHSGGTTRRRAHDHGFHSPVFPFHSSVFLSCVKKDYDGTPFRSGVLFLRFVFCLFLPRYILSEDHDGCMMGGTDASARAPGEIG